MLDKLRDSLELSLARVGKSFASTGLSANFWTGVGLVVSVLAGVTYASNQFADIDWTPWSFAGVMGGVLLLFSGFCDVVDGAWRVSQSKRRKRGRLWTPLLTK